MIATRFAVPRDDAATARLHCDPHWLENRLGLFRRFFVPSVAPLGVPAVLLCAALPGRAAIGRLIDRADVFVSNYREDALARMGLGYDALRQRNPGLVYAIATGFGSEGPDAGKAMVDGAGQARAGLVHVTGAPDGAQLMPGAALADTAGALQLALGILTALVARERLTQVTAPDAATDVPIEADNP